MAGMIFGLFALGILLLFGMINTIRVGQRTASYPPKYVLKKRTALFGASAAGVFLLAFILYYVA
jgi:hypothetical protein